MGLIILRYLILVAVVLFGLAILAKKLWKVSLTEEKKEELEKTLAKIETNIELAERIKDVPTVKRLEKAKQKITKTLKLGEKT